MKTWSATFVAAALLSLCGCGSVDMYTGPVLRECVVEPPQGADPTAYGWEKVCNPYNSWDCGWRPGPNARKVLCPSDGYYGGYGYGGYGYGRSNFIITGRRGHIRGSGWGSGFIFFGN